MKGAVIASTATPDKNLLSTNTFNFSDINNNANYSSSSIGANYDSGTYKPGDPNYKNQGLTPNIGVTATGNSNSTTHSEISTGTIIVGGVKVNPVNLSRDTTNSVNALGKIFDQETVTEQQELAGLFGKMAYEEVHKISIANGWDSKDPQKVALDAIVGGIMSEFAGGGFASGAAGAGFNEAIQSQLAKIKDPALHQWASALVGSVAAQIVGGNAQTGASAAVSGTKNNFLQFILAEEGLTAAAGAAYKFLANTPEGQAILEKMGIAAEDISTAGEETLSKLVNEAEALYIRIASGGVQVLGRGSTGTTVANSLFEQIAMKIVRWDPLDGATRVPIPMTDTRWDAVDGWIKMQRIVTSITGEKVNIHFVYNTITGAFDDFKFK